MNQKIKYSFATLLLLISVSAFSSPIEYDEEYVKRNGKWYFQVVTYSDCGGMPSYIEIVGIDIASFKVLKYQPWKWSDSKSGTFYAKDKNAVYYRGERVKGADPLTFRMLDENNSNYAIDRFGLYYNGTPLMYSLPKNYKIFDANNNKWESVYVISNNRVFFKENEIKGADAKTFEVIEDIFFTLQTLCLCGKKTKSINLQHYRGVFVTWCLQCSQYWFQ